jgi:DNA-directed RNA polymerase specialized sigma24 family protein
MIEVSQRAEFEPYLGAASGSEVALGAVRMRHAELIARMRAEGIARYGDLGLGEEACGRGFARIVAAVLEAEADALPGEPLPAIDEVCGTIVLPDAYLAQALVEGRAEAWQTLEELLDTAWRTVRAHFAGQASRLVLEEIRESILGTFFLDGKVATYRATAPIGAWARQVIFNLFRQRMNQRRSGHVAPALSQIGETDADLEGLLPPSRELPPPDAMDRTEWSEVFARIVPEALAVLDRDERRMLEVLPSKAMTQVQLCKELGVSPFKLNRWYKDVRRRFLREVTHRLRLLSDLDEVQADRLVAYLAGLWSQEAVGDSTQEPQSE